MSLLPLFDLSLIGRAEKPALECPAADGSRLQFTFGELETRSNRLAHLLRTRGLGCDSALAASSSTSQRGASAGRKTARSREVTTAVGAASETM